MGNKTFIPAFQCSVGDWKYYMCTMKYGEVARQVQFAYELGSENTELGDIIQRGLSARTKGITEYLIKSRHRFLGALVVAAWGGEPQYTPLSMEDPEGMLSGLDRGFGVLMFDGSQQYFALDGQHRLKAIKEALKQNPDLAREDICVLIVTHYDTPEGRTRTRRLFSNINRNAKQTGTAENIALDEDDGFALLTRRILQEHSFLREDGRVRVILSVSQDGELKLATSSIPKTDPRAITTFTVLYDVLQYLGWDLPSTIRAKSVRPPDDDMDESFARLVARLDALLSCCGRVRLRLEEMGSARELRAPKVTPPHGHPFMRPVVQKVVARVASELVQQKLLTWDEVTERLSQLEWELEAPPWQAVYSVDGGKMLVGKENRELLGDLLHVHLAPASQQAIKRARKNFRDIRNAPYPVAEEVLAERLPKGGAPPPVTNVVLPEAEASADEGPPAAEGDAAPGE